MRRKGVFSLLLFLAAVLVGCAGKKQNGCELYAMDTFITLSGENADTKTLAAVNDEVLRIERVFSRTMADSELTAVNENRVKTVSDETAYVLARAFDISDATDAAFDPCLGAVSSLWSFTSSPYVPTEKELAALLPFTDPHDVAVKGNTVDKRYAETVLDLGACVKGYTAGRAIRVFNENGIENAVVSIGGNIGVSGNSPSGGLWRIGIKNPFLPDTLLGTVACTDTVVSVSGAYERYFEKDGTVYHHIIDAKTGRPSDSGLAETAVFCKDGLLCDALSTALFVMGKEKALAFYEKHIYDFEAILVTDEGEIIPTDGIAEVFTAASDAVTKDGQPLTVVDANRKNT